MLSSLRGWPFRGLLSVLCATAFCAALAFCVNPAHAQENRGIDVETFRPAVDAEGYLGFNGTTMPGHLQWTVGMWTHYGKQLLMATRSNGEDEQEFDLIRHRLTSNLQFQVGLGSRWAIALDVPIVMFQSGNLSPVDPGAPPSLTLASQAFGDPRIASRYRLLGKGASVTRERADGPGLALEAGFTLPFGDDDSFAGEGDFTFDIQAIADIRILDIAAGIMLGFRHRFENENIVGVEFRDQLMFGVGVTVPIPVLVGLAARAEVRGVFDARFGGSGRTAVEGNLAFSYERGAVSYLIGVGMGFSDGVGSPSVRAMASVVWAPRSSDNDADLDGIPDDIDECPHLPEDLDGFQDEDGCMDPDNDNDFVPDVDDLCPLEPADEDADEDEDGCTDQ